MAAVPRGDSVYRGAISLLATERLDASPPRCCERIPTRAANPEPGTTAPGRDQVGTVGGVQRLPRPRSGSKWTEDDRVGQGARGRIILVHGLSLNDRTYPVILDRQAMSVSRGCTVGEKPPRIIRRITYSGQRCHLTRVPAPHVIRRMKAAPPRQDVAIIFRIEPADPSSPPKIRMVRTFGRSDLHTSMMTS